MRSGYVFLFMLALMAMGDVAAEKYPQLAIACVIGLFALAIGSVNGLVTR